MAVHIWSSRAYAWSIEKNETEGGRQAENEARDLEEGGSKGRERAMNS